jgi:hypothetical protein
MGLGAKVAVRAVDKGWDELRQTLKNIRERDSYVKAGVFGDSETNKRDDGELTNVDLAVIHEFGAPKASIPARSFIRATFDMNHASYKQMLRGLIPKIYELKMDVKRALGLLGAKMAADMKKRVVTGVGIPPPNAPSTVAKKLAKGKNLGNNSASKSKTPRPLVDSGRLVDSITWEVVTKGGSDKHG